MTEGSIANAINVLANDTDPDPADTRTITASHPARQRATVITDGATV